jgi:hypothetical protein
MSLEALWFPKATWHILLVSGGDHYYTPPPTTPVAKLSVRNGYVRTNSGLTFTFPGDNGVVEIETLVTMNASGVDCVVLRSLDGQKMISNLDPGGLDLPSGSGMWTCSIET